MTAEGRSERFRNRDKGFLRNKWRLEKLRKNKLGSWSMASADEYYGYVEQCIALSSRCLHSGDKVRLLQMAKAWRELAEKLEASEKKSAENDPA